MQNAFKGFQVESVLVWTEAAHSVKIDQLIKIFIGI